MTPYAFLDAPASAVVPASGRITRVLNNTEGSKVIEFTLAAGAELSAHTAPCPIALYCVRGEGVLWVGEEMREVAAGAFAHLPAKLEHAIRARSELVMLLVMEKGSVA